VSNHRGLAGAALLISDDDDARYGQSFPLPRDLQRR
jgi:hypothetical protein